MLLLNAIMVLLLIFIFCYPLGFYGTCAVIECHYGIFIILFFCYPLDFYGTCAVIVLLNAVIDCIIIVMFLWHLCCY